jgi:hypothetical protein
MRLKNSRAPRRSPAAQFVMSVNAGAAGTHPNRRTIMATFETFTASSTPLVAHHTGSRVWAGRVLTGLIAAFLLFDGIAKLIPLAVVVEASRQLGLATEIIRPLGALLVASTILHLIPRTQLLGALLLTAYLGGATATHVLTGTPFWFPVAMGLLLWAALCLRNPRARALVLAPRAA